MLSPPPKLNFFDTIRKLLKNRNLNFPIFQYFTWKLGTFSVTAALSHILWVLHRSGTYLIRNKKIFKCMFTHGFSFNVVRNKSRHFWLFYYIFPMLIFKDSCLSALCSLWTMLYKLKQKKKQKKLFWQEIKRFYRLT